MPRRVVRCPVYVCRVEPGRDRCGPGRRAGHGRSCAASGRAGLGPRGRGDPVGARPALPRPATPAADRVRGPPGAGELACPPPQRPTVPYRAGGRFARGQFRREFPKGDNVATSRNPEARCYFMVGSGWFLLFPGGLDGNNHIVGASLRLVHHCTCLNLQYSPASEFAMKLVTCREKFARGAILPPFSTAKHPLPEPPPSCIVSCCDVLYLLLLLAPSQCPCPPGGGRGQLL